MQKFLSLKFDPRGKNKDFVLKKLGLTTHEFEKLMQLPPRQHTDFETEAASYFDKYPIFKPLKGVYNLIKPKK